MGFSTTERIIRRNIRVRMAILDKSFSDLARVIGCSKTKIHRLYNGPMNGRKIDEWSVYLGVPPSILVSRRPGIIADYDLSQMEEFFDEGITTPGEHE